MPIREFQCRDCMHIFETVVDRNSDPDVEVECRCGSTKVDRLISVTGGYKMNSGGSSTRPKSAGSRPKGCK